jgi:hypothetical protein
MCGAYLYGPGRSWGGGFSRPWGNVDLVSEDLVSFESTSGATEVQRQGDEYGDRSSVYSHAKYR